jgi:hypothetical protein
MVVLAVAALVRPIGRDFVVCLVSADCIDSLGWRDSPKHPGRDIF